jgi:hypothetical protein
MDSRPKRLLKGYGKGMSRLKLVDMMISREEEEKDDSVRF